MNVKELLDSVVDCRDECKDLMEESDWYDTYERREQYQRALSTTKEVKSKLNKRGEKEVKKLDMKHPFDSAEEFFFEEGWTIDDYSDVEGMDDIERLGEAMHCAAVAISELEWVDSEPISDSRPYAQAGLCAKEAMDSAVNQLESIN